MTFLERAWAFLTDPANRAVLAWLGGGLVVVLGGAWTAFTYFRPGLAARKAERGPSAVRASHDSIAAGNAINISGTGKPRRHRKVLPGDPTTPPNSR
jgi:hypothetical protein